MTKILLAILLLVFVATDVNAAVWTTRHQWDADWEKKFDAWVAGSEWQKDFFVHSGPYQNLKLDCADAVYSMRFIFAAKNGLPFVIQDPTGGGGKISNEMTRWDSQSSNQRLRSFISYIYRIASTSSLPNDTYPVAVSRRAMGSGSLILADAKSRHTWTVKYLSEVGVPFTLSRSLPPTTLMFEHYEFPPVEFVFSGGLSPERNSGFRRFRQPSYIGKSSWDVPGYSTEQYKVPLKKWNSYMQGKLALRNESSEEKMTRLLEGACRVSRDRAVVTGLGNRYLSNMSRTCMNDSEFDDYSTPSRDKRLKMTFVEFVIEAQKSRGKISHELQAKIDNVLAGEDSMSSSPYCMTKIADGLSLSLGQVHARVMKGKLSTSPHDTLKMRWGFAAFPGQRAQHCGR